MDWNGYKEDGIMRAFEAECLDRVCRNSLTSKIFNRRTLTVWHALFRPWPFTGWEGVSSKSVRFGSIEATLDAILVLQCFCRDLLQKIGLWVGLPIAVIPWRRRWWRRSGRRRRWRRPWLNRSQGAVGSPMIGIVPSQIGSYAHEMMLRQGECFGMAITKKRKQADCRCSKEKKCQNDK